MGTDGGPSRPESSWVSLPNSGTQLVAYLIVKSSQRASPTSGKSLGPQLNMVQPAAPFIQGAQPKAHVDQEQLQNPDHNPA